MTLLIFTYRRSAVLFGLKAYGMAIDDITLAFRLGYPDDLAYKLYDRKAKCLVAFKQMADAEVAYKAALKYVDKASKLTKEKKQQVQRDIIQALQFYKAAPAALTKNQDVDMKGKVIIYQHHVNVQNHPRDVISRSQFLKFPILTPCIR